MSFINDAILRALVGFQGLEARITDVETRVKDEKGQTLAEYGLIMAVIAVAVVVGAGVLFRTALVSAFNAATDCLNGTTTGC